MSQSIFHVRPLDAGKGWAIDEYDGRGAWQRTIPQGPDGAPMDKQQAQRAVFQLRRKAVNSAPKVEPVNKEIRATGPSLTAQELAREYIEEHYGYGPPQETVEDLALVLERFAADSVNAAGQVWLEAHPCRACDGRGWQVIDVSTANESAQDTRECQVCEGSGVAS